MLVETPQDERVRHVQAIITETLEKDDELQRFVDCPAQKHGSAILACLFSDRRRNGKRKTFQQSSSWMAQPSITRWTPSHSQNSKSTICVFYVKERWTTRGGSGLCLLERFGDRLAHVHAMFIRHSNTFLEFLAFLDVDACWSCSFRCCCVDLVELMYGWILWWTRCGLVPACQSLLPRCQKRQHPRVFKGNQFVVRNLMSSCYMLLLFTLHSLDYIHRENESIRYFSEFCFVKISGRLQWLCPRGYQCARAFQLRQMLWFDPFVLFFQMVQTELYLLWSWPVRPIYCSDLDSVPVLDATLLAVTTCSSQALSEFSPSSPTDYHRAGNTAVARTEVYGSALGTLLGSGMNYSMWITGVCLLSHLNTLTFISSQPGSCHKSV